MTSTHNRFRTASTACPICGGHDKQDRDSGQRCGGYSGDDPRYVYCTNSNYAGHVQRDANGTYRHYRGNGVCHCGNAHISVDGTGFTLPTPASTPNPQTARREVETVYDYRDEGRNILFQAVRFRNPKSFSQRRPQRPDDPPATVREGYIWSLDGVRRVLYRLPELLAETRTQIFVVEGEKDVETLRKHGLPATCNPMGAGKWQDDYSEHLAGRQIIILPDNDERGRSHAEAVALSVSRLAENVKIVALPGLAEKGDVSDWLTTHTPAELTAFCDGAPLWIVPATAQSPKLLYTVAELATIPPPRWLLEPELQRDSITVLVGEPGIGKSFLALDWALQVAQTENVVYIAGEGASGYQQRIEAWAQYHKGKTDKLFIWIEPVRVANIEDVARFALEIEPLKPALIIVDTLARAALGMEENSARDMGLVDEALMGLKRRFNACVLVLHHAGKDGKYRGSSALLGNPDSFFVMKAVGTGARLMCTKQRNSEASPGRAIGWRQIGQSRVPVAPDQATQRGSVTTEIERAILLELSDPMNERGLTSRRLKEILDFSDSAVYNALKSLFSMGYVEQGARGEPFTISTAGRDIVGKGKNPFSPLDER